MRLAVGLVTAVVLVGLAWVVVTGLMARHQSHRLISDITALRADLLHGNMAKATELEKRIESTARRMHDLTGGPAWWVGAKIPWLGAPARTAREGTGIVDELASEVLPRTVEARHMLRPDNVVAGTDHVDLATVHRAADLMRPTAQQARALLARAEGLPDDTWLALVNDNRRELVTQASPVVHLLTELAKLSRALPNALGETVTRRYLVVFQTNAEPRGLGGLPGSWAVLSARDGQLRLSQFGNDNDFHGIRAHVRLGDPYRHAYKHLYRRHFRPTRSWLNSDPSPQFSDAARIWMAMWEERFHRHISGAITTDPGGLQLLLDAVGPVTLEDGMVINTTNVVPFFENGIYQKFASDEGTPRKLYQQHAAEAIAKHILAQHEKDFGATTTAIREAIDARRLLLYTKNRRIESAIRNHPISGNIPITTAPFMGVTVNEVNAGKIGFYFRRRVTYERSTCEATTSTTTYRIHNSAPADVLPYVAGTYRDTPLAGGTAIVVMLYSTHLAEPVSLTVNGKRTPVQIKHERHHLIAKTPRLFLRRGGTKTLVFKIHEPAATGPLITMRQPGVRPLTQTVEVPSCPVTAEGN